MLITAVERSDECIMGCDVYKMFSAGVDCLFPENLMSSTRTRTTYCAYDLLKEHLRIQYINMNLFSYGGKGMLIQSSKVERCDKFQY